MDTERGYLKARFAFVRQDLEGVLRRLNDADLNWSLNQGMPTVSDLLLEIANKEMETIVWLNTGEWPDGEPDAFEDQSATLDGIRSKLASLRVSTHAYIDLLSDQQLDELVVNPDRWWEGMRLPACPRSEIVRNIAAHEWYHTAQLVTYLWIRGDDPEEW